MGGYVSEKMIFKDITTGASNDLKNATDIARSLVVKYGMSEKLGPISLGGQSEMVFLGKELGTEKEYSEETASLIDKEVSKFLTEAYNTAQDVLEKNRTALDAIAKRLMEKENIEKDDFEDLVKQFGIEKKK